MINEEVRSTKGRPRASTPVATRGTACTIRVLRRFLNSVLGLTAPSDTISAASSAKLPPDSSMPSAVVPQLLRICANAWRWRHGFLIARLEYLPRSACGVFRSGTSMLPLRPRSVQPINRSALGKTPDDLFIPAGFVLVVVLRHVVRQARHQRTSCQPISTAM